MLCIYVYISIFDIYIYVYICTIYIKHMHRYGTINVYILGPQGRDS